MVDWRIEAISAALCLAAITLMTYRKRVAWLLFVAYSLSLAYVSYVNGLWWYVGLGFVTAVLNAQGYWRWGRESHE